MSKRKEEEEKWKRISKQVNRWYDQQKDLPFTKKRNRTIGEILDDVFKEEELLRNPVYTQAKINGKSYDLEPPLTEKEIDELLSDKDEVPGPGVCPKAGGVIFPEGYTFPNHPAVPRGSMTKREGLGRDHPVDPFKIPTKECTDCGGTGEYRGLKTVEPCKTCKGVKYI